MKFCSKCGNSNTDEAVFCASCGTPLDQAPAAPAAPEQPAQPEQPAYTAPTYTAPTYDSSAYTAQAAPVAEQKNSATLWLILNIVATVLCCPNIIVWIFSIIGIVTAGLGMSAFKKGDFEEMKKKSKLSMIMFIVAIAIGIVSGILGIALGIVGNIMEGNF